MNYSQGFYNMKDYMGPNNVPPYYGNVQMPVMGMACMDNMGYISSMPFIPDSYIPVKSNMPMPDGDMPALPNMPNGNMPTMPNMPNMNMPTYPTMPTMPGMPNSNMPGMPNSNMPGMPNGNMPGMPNGNMPGMPNSNMPGMPNGNMPGMPNGNMPTMPNSNMTSPTMPGQSMNCQQLREYMQRMNCMDNMNNITPEE
nr:hypothetical protein [Sedimentibacter sp.]